MVLNEHHNNRIPFYPQQISLSLLKNIKENIFDDSNSTKK